jgi:hypothetical protein
MIFQINQMKTSGKFLTKLIIATFATMSVVGCGKTDSETKSTSASDLTGDWVLDCHGSNESYSRDMQSFTADGSMIVTTTTASDAACAVDVSKILAVAYAFKTSESSVAGAIEIDATKLPLAIMIPMNASYVATLNAGSICGATDWAIGTQKDVSACTVIYDEIPSSIYSLAKVDTTATPNTLQLGDCKSDSAINCATDAKRATSLASDVYKKDTSSSAIRLIK